MSVQRTFRKSAIKSVFSGFYGRADIVLAAVGRFPIAHISGPSSRADRAMLDSRPRCGGSKIFAMPPRSQRGPGRGFRRCRLSVHRVLNRDRSRKAIARRLADAPSDGADMHIAEIDMPAVGA